MVDLISKIIGIRGLLVAIAALLAVCIGLGTTVVIQSARLDAAQARETSLGDKLSTQNRAVQKWKADAVRQEAAAEKAARRAEKVRIVTVERIREVAAAPVPSACPDAIRWGTEQALEFNKHWGAK